MLIAHPFYGCHNPNYAGAFVRSTFRELERPLDRMAAVYGRLPRRKRPRWAGGDKRRWTWPSGAILQLGYTDKGLAWAQGGNFTEVLWDEIANEPKEKKCDTLIAEIRSGDPSIVTQFVGSGNPGFAGHPWVKRRWIVPCGKRGERIAWVKVAHPITGAPLWRSRQFVPSRVTDNPHLLHNTQYMATLAMLPERMRLCLLDGDWDASTGVAYDEMDNDAHLVAPFECPAHWPWIAAFDWGFSHWAVLMYGRVSDDGRVYIVDTVKRRLLRDWDLAATFVQMIPAPALLNVQAGHDCWQQGNASRGDGTKSTAEYFGERGIHLVQASIGREMGYKNALEYLAWRETQFFPQRTPMVRFFNTPTNKWLVEDHLPAQVMDPDDPTSLLKQDADSDTGEGGDDAADAFRYLLASRPFPAESLKHLIRVSAFDEEVLRAEMEKFRRPELALPPGQMPANRHGVFPGAS